MKATKGSPSSRSVSAIYNRAAIHQPSYDAAKKVKRNRRRRRKQNRDSSTDSVHRINIGVVEGLYDNFTTIVAYVGDPESFCKYFRIHYNPKQWRGGIFDITYVPKPHKLRSDAYATSRSLSETKATDRYYRYLNAGIAKTLRAIRHLQCPGRVDSRLLKPRFKFVFTSDIPWFARMVHNWIKVRPLEVRKKHKQTAINPKSSFTRQIVEFHQLIATEGAAAFTNMDIASSRYIPCASAANIGTTIRSILEKFHTRYEAFTKRDPKAILPPEFGSTSGSDKRPKAFTCYNIKHTAKHLSKATKRALRHYSAIKKELRHTPKSCRKLTASFSFVEILSSANLNPNRPWPTWIIILRNYLVHLVGKTEAFVQPPTPPSHPSVGNTSSKALNERSVEFVSLPTAVSCRLQDSTPERRLQVGLVSSFPLNQSSTSPPLPPAAPMSNRLRRFLNKVAAQGAQPVEESFQHCNPSVKIRPDLPFDPQTEDLFDRWRELTVAAFALEGHHDGTSLGSDYHYQP